MVKRRQRDDIRHDKKRELINKLRNEYGDRCCYCDGYMRFDYIQSDANDPDVRSLEHLIEYGRGGRDDLDNLLLAHRQCNSLAGTLSMEQKEHYVGNPSQFVKDFLNGHKIQCNQYKASNARRCKPTSIR